MFHTKIFFKSKDKLCVQSLSRVQLFMVPWTVVCQAPLTIAFSQQEYWSMWSFSTPGDHPDPEMEPTSLVSPALAGRFFTTEPSKLYIFFVRFFSVVRCYKILNIVLYAIQSALVVYFILSSVYLLIPNS